MDDVPRVLDTPDVTSEFSSCRGVTNPAVTSLRLLRGVLPRWLAVSGERSKVQVGALQVGTIDVSSVRADRLGRSMDRREP